MAYIPKNFSTTAVINADTLFQNYDDEVQVLMSDVGDYLTTEMTKVYEETEIIVTDGITVNSVETIEDLATQDGVVFKTIIVKDFNRGGTFIWSSTGTANGGTVFAGASGYWTRQYDGAVNVKWFGAKGDGITDDTVAIQSANAFGDIYIGHGSIFLVSSINVHNDIQGTGTIKQKPLTNNFMLIGQPSTAITITGVTLDQNNSLQTTGSGKFLFNSEAVACNITFNGVTFKDFCEGAVRIIGVKGSTREVLTLNNCKFRGGTETEDGVYNTYTVFVGDASELVVDGCDFDHGLIISKSGIPAITVAGVDTASEAYTEVHITNNRFKGYGRFSVAGGIGTIDCYVWAESVVISNNKFYDSYVVPIRAKANAKNLIISGNILASFIPTATASFGGGISIISQTLSPTNGRYIISDNIIDNPYYRGIEISDSTSLVDMVIVDNNIINSSADIGIYVNKLSNFVISNNIVKDAGQQGIAYANCAGSGKIIDNTVDTPALSGIVNVGSQASLYITIARNSVNNSTALGIGCENVRALFLADNIVKDVVNGGASGQRGYRVGGSIGINYGQIKNNLAIGTFVTAQYSIITNGFLNYVYERGNSWDYQEKYAPSAPTIGTWERGSIVWNTAPSASGFIGWVCTTDGTPGTWKTFGAISA